MCNKMIQVHVVRNRWPKEGSINSYDLKMDHDAAAPFQFAVLWNACLADQEYEQYIL